MLHMLHATPNKWLLWPAWGLSTVDHFSCTWLVRTNWCHVEMTAWLVEKQGFKFRCTNHPLKKVQSGSKRSIRVSFKMFNGGIGQFSQGLAEHFGELSVPIILFFRVHHGHLATSLSKYVRYRWANLVRMTFNEKNVTCLYQVGGCFPTHLKKNDAHQIVSSSPKVGVKLTKIFKTTTN